LTGPYYPLLVRIEGPADAVALLETGGQYESEVLHLTIADDLGDIAGPSVHGIVSEQGQYYCSGDEPKVGVFVAKGSHPHWSTSDGEFLGAGHIARGRFRFVHLNSNLQRNTLPGPPKVIARNERFKQVYGAGPELFNVLQTVANARRQARFGAAPAPGSTYSPSYINGSLEAGTEDPRQVFAEYLWPHWMTTSRDDCRALNMAILADRDAALRNMVWRNPKGWFGNVPGTANDIFAKAKGYPGTSVPALSKLQGSTTCVLGSSRLIGEWKSWAGITEEGDWPCNCQNWSHILHFNQGLGWEKLRAPDPVDGQKAIAYKVYDLVTDPNLTVVERKQKIVLCLLDAGFGLPGVGPALAPMLTTKPELAANIYDKMIHNHTAWKKMVDAIILAKPFAKNGKPDALSIYIAYNIQSGEAFHVFGHDPFSDVIATEGGRLFAEEMLKAASAITTKADIVPQMEAKMQAARQSFVQHPVWTSKSKPQEIVEKAFYSMFLAINANGTMAFEVKNGGHHLKNTIVWRRTFWNTLCSAEFETRYKQDSQALLGALQDHLSDVTKRKTSFVLDTKQVIDALGVEVLNEMIEVPMLLEELPAT